MFLYEFKKVYLEVPPEEEETDLQKLRRAAKDGDLEAGMTGNDRVSSDVLSKLCKTSIPSLRKCRHSGFCAQAEGC